jgi:hypothetical protein
MKTFIETLYFRNEPLFFFGAACFIAAFIFFILSRVTEIQVTEVNAWYKPIKFALSIGIYSWTMAWYLEYLGDFSGLKLFNWVVIILFGFEIVYIAIQAGRGQLSHFNVSSSFYSTMYGLMGLAAVIVTLWTAYIGVLFFLKSFPYLPDYYLWAIRIGIIIFVIFSLEGILMGSRMSHTVGGPDGAHGIPFFGWSLKYGDLRVAHFIGMHALQVLPILAFHVLKNVKATFMVGALYALLAVYILIITLQGKPFYRF